MKKGPACAGPFLEQRDLTLVVLVLVEIVLILVWVGGRTAIGFAAFALIGMLTLLLTGLLAALGLVLAGLVFALVIILVCHAKVPYGLVIPT